MKRVDKPQDYLKTNPGKAVKIISQLISNGMTIAAGLVALVAVGIGIYFLFDDWQAGIWIMLGGVAAALAIAYLASVLLYTLYAFGELVENSSKLVESISTPAENSSKPASAVPSASSLTGTNTSAPSGGTQQSIPSEFVPTHAATPAQERKETLEDALRWSLLYSTTDGMISYLKMKAKNYSEIANLLKLPAKEIRPAILAMLGDSPANGDDSAE